MTLLFLTASVALLHLKLQHQILVRQNLCLPNYGCSVSILPQVSTNLKPPEGVAAVCVVTQKEASGLGGVVEQAFSGKALCLGDVSDLKQRKTNVYSISCCRVNSSSITSTHSFRQASQPFQTRCLILTPFSKQRTEVAYDFYVQTLQLTCNIVSCHGIFQLQYVQKRLPTHSLVGQNCAPDQFFCVVSSLSITLIPTHPVSYSLICCWLAQPLAPWFPAKLTGTESLLHCTLAHSLT